MAWSRGGREGGEVLAWTGETSVFATLGRAGRSGNRVQSVASTRSSLAWSCEWDGRPTSGAAEGREQTRYIVSARLDWYPFLLKKKKTSDSRETSEKGKAEYE